MIILINDKIPKSEIMKGIKTTATITTKKKRKKRKIHLVGQEVRRKKNVV